MLRAVILLAIKKEGLRTMSVKREIKSVIFTIVASIISGLALHVFVYPADFVSLGLEAVVTMLQKLTGVNAGWFNLVLNIPLIIWAWFKLDKRYVVYTLLFTFLSSISLILLELWNFPQYSSENDRIISAIFAGVLIGTRTAIMFKVDASTGGIDIIACIVQKKLQYVNVERIISVICCGIIGASYFVYKDFNCILLSIVLMFISEKVITFMMKDTREALEVKIVTKYPKEITEEFVANLQHTATIISSKGAYTNAENSVILAVINRRQLPQFIKIVKKYPETFAYYSDVQGVYGKFRKHKDGPLVDTRTNKTTE